MGSTEPHSFEQTVYPHRNGLFESIYLARDAVKAEGAFGAFLRRLRIAMAAIQAGTKIGHYEIVSLIGS